MTKCTLIILMMINGNPEVSWQDYESSDPATPAMTLCLLDGEEVLKNNPEGTVRVICDPVPVLKSL